MSTLTEDRSPIRGEILKTFRRPAEDEISATMKRAREAFIHWSQTPIEERSRCVNFLRNYYEKKAVSILRHERRKPHGPSRTLPPSLNTTRWGLFLFWLPGISSTHPFAYLLSG